MVCVRFGNPFKSTSISGEPISKLNGPDGGLGRAAWTAVNNIAVIIEIMRPERIINGEGK